MVKVVVNVAKKKENKHIQNKNFQQFCFQTDDTFYYFLKMKLKIKTTTLYSYF